MVEAQFLVADPVAILDRQLHNGLAFDVLHPVVELAFDVKAGRLWSPVAEDLGSNHAQSRERILQGDAVDRAMDLPENSVAKSKGSGAVTIVAEVTSLTDHHSDARLSTQDCPHRWHRIRGIRAVGVDHSDVGGARDFPMDVLQSLADRVPLPSPLLLDNDSTVPSGRIGRRISRGPIHHQDGWVEDPLQLVAHSADPVALTIRRNEDDGFLR